MKNIKPLLCLALAASISCSSFIRDENINELLLLEKGVYILKTDVDIGGKSLKKGDSVGLIITHDDEWIKVEAYLLSKGKLKGERVRLIYLFGDDFPKEKFEVKRLKDELFRYITEKK